MTFWQDPVNFIANWLRGLLVSGGLSEGLTALVMQTIGVVAVVGLAMTLIIFLLVIERKAVARVQDRLGPNRVGPWGMFQSFPDMIKLITKEIITPTGIDWVPYNLAPLLAMAAVLLIWAVVPFAPTIIGADVNVGVLYILAVGSLGILAVLLAGWSSNNKYALLGAFRAVAQLVSYEIPMVLAILVVVLLARSMGINAIVAAQEVWFVALAPLAALLFTLSGIAENGRAPFDLLEADSEIVAGYNVEYSGMMFGMFMVSEFMHTFVVAMLIAALFFGGWRGPGVDTIPTLGVVYFFLKTGGLYFFLLLIRYTLPRVRIDQMLNLNWKFLVPLGLVALIVTAVVEQFVMDAGLLTRTLVHLAANGVVAFGAWELLRGFARRERQRERVSEPRPLAVPPPAE
jgi:NADH-quinone oxidoreductase subunit H